MILEMSHPLSFISIDTERGPCTGNEGSYRANRLLPLHQNTALSNVANVAGFHVFIAPADGDYASWTSSFLTMLYCNWTMYKFDDGGGSSSS